MIQKIDHVVITTTSPKDCLDFYQKLGFKIHAAGERYELFAGDFKINVHIIGQELSPHAKNVQTGSTDLCFEINGKLEEFLEEITKKNIVVEIGIAQRIGTKGVMHSIYLRDPDGNLIEFCSYE